MIGVSQLKAQSISSGKTFRLKNQRAGYLYKSGDNIAGTSSASQASVFTLVTNSTLNGGIYYLYDVTNNAFVHHTGDNPNNPGSYGNYASESEPETHMLVSAAFWLESTDNSTYPYKIRGNMGNYLNVDSQPGYACFNTWSSTDAGNSFAIEYLDNISSESETYQRALKLLDNYFSYAELSSDNTKLTFYYDNQRASREGTTYSLNTGNNDPGWYNYRESITSVEFSDLTTFKTYFKPTSTYRWFNGMTNLTDIHSLYNLNTSEVTNMRGMFYGCSKLTSLDFSGFNTEKVTDMAFMFQHCPSLTSLNVSSFNTASVTDMTAMFDGCSSLTSLDVSGFNTANVTNMTQMFYNCSKLTTLDVSGFNTAKVGNFSMMFYNCQKLTSLDVSGFNTAKATTMSSMFSGCSSLTSLDVSDFNTEKVTAMNYMFNNCSKLTSLDVSGFNTANVTNMSYMFYYCSKVPNLDVSGFNTAKVTDISYMFRGCNLLKELNVSSFNTALVTKMDYMFANCGSLTTIYASDTWTTNAVTSSSSMFSGSTKIVGGAGTTYNSNATNANYAHIDGGTANPGYLTSDKISFADANVKAICVANWDTNGDGELSLAEAAAVTSDQMGTTFSENKNITSFNELRFFTGLDRLRMDAFYNCTALQSITLPESLTSIGIDCFWDCSSLKALHIPKSVTSIGNYITAGCAALETITVDPENTVLASPNNCNAIIKEGTLLVAGCKNTVIPDGITTIGVASMNGFSLTNIVIPASVTEIQMNGFGKNGTLQTVTMLATEPPLLQRGAFGPTATLQENCILIVPDDSREAYLTAEAGSQAFTYAETFKEIRTASFSNHVHINNVEATTSDLATLAVINNDVVENRPTISVTAGAPAYFNINGFNGWWQKKVGGEFTNVYSGLFTPGTWRFHCQVRIDGDDATSNVLASPLTVKVNDVEWTVEYVNLADDYSFCFVSSPEIEVTVPNEVINFADANVKAICVANWDTDGDGELSTVEAASVTNLQGWAKQDIIPDNTYFIRNVGTGQFLTGGNQWGTQISLSEDQTPYIQIRVESLPAEDQAAYPNCYMLRLDGSYTFGTISKTDTYLFRYGRDDTSIGFVDAPNTDVCRYFRIVKNANGHYTIQSAPGLSGLNTNGSEYAGGDGPGAPVFFNLGETNPYIEWDFVSTSPNGFNGTNITSFNELQYFTGLTEIPENTFYSCSDLQSITFPTSITKIGSFAFAGCAALQDLVIPEGVTEIDAFAFRDYTGLVTLPTTVTSIGSYAFENCSGLKVSWTTPPAANGLLNNDQFGQEHADPKKPLYVPIGSYEAFDIPYWWRFDIREYGIIPFEDEDLEMYLFFALGGNVEGHVTAEEAAAVTNFSELSLDGYKTELTTFKEFKYFTGLTGIPSDAFRGFTNLTSIALPRTMTAIPDGAFINCSSLTDVDIPESVISIGLSAFNSCSSLTELKLPPLLETIGAYAFTNSGLQRFNIPAFATDFNDAFAATSTVVPLYVTTEWTEPVAITENTFPQRSQATLFVPLGSEETYAEAPYWQDFGHIVGHIIFEDPTVKAICIEHFDTNHDGELTIAEAEAVTSFGSYYDDPNSLIFAGNSEIQSFNELKYFTGLQDIEAFAFAYCENLASITLPSNIKTIGNQAFQSTNLHSIEIPEGVTTIYGAAFYNCKQLTNVILPSTLLRISTNAFNGCSNLRFIEIPESVTEFGNYTFNNCTALTQVRVKWDTPLEIGDADPFPTRADITLVVPPHTSDAYSTATYWQEFKNFQEQEPAWLTYTDENGDIYQYEPGYSAQLYHYADKSGRTTFVMPESITVDGVTYPVTAIAGLHSGYLQSLIIPASVTTVKDEAFSCLIAPDQGLTLKEIRMLGSEPPVAGRFDGWRISLVGYNMQMQHQYPDDPSKQVSFKDILLEVPAGTKADYQAANLWKEFTVKEDEAYAHVSADGTTLTFYYDELKTTRDGHVYPLNEEYDLPQWTSNAWNNSIQTVVFDTSFAKARPTTTAKWFVNMEQLTTITGLENLNTSEVTNMSQMFSYCKQLTALDLSTLNTEKVQTMYGMFLGCENLTSLNLSNFNTAAVFNLSRMFTLCTRLSTLDISSFNTANVTIITNMFSLCGSLMTIYVGNGWSTANVDKSNLNNYCDMFLGDNMLEGGAGTRYMDYQWSTEGNDDIEYARVDAPGAPGYLTFNGAFIQGDVNGDGSVTIADVTALVNIILGKTQAPASGVADVNGDHATTIADVTALVNIILGKN
jgi:surface protein